MLVVDANYIAYITVFFKTCKTANMVRNQIEKTEHNSVPREPTLFANANGSPVFDSSVSA